MKSYTVWEEDRLKEDLEDFRYLLFVLFGDTYALIESASDSLDEFVADQMLAIRLGLAEKPKAAEGRG